MALILKCSMGVFIFQEERKEKKKEREREHCFLSPSFSVEAAEEEVVAVAAASAVAAVVRRKNEINGPYFLKLNSHWNLCLNSFLKRRIRILDIFYHPEWYTHIHTHLLPHSFTNEKSIKVLINNQDTYIFLFEGNLKYPMISHSKRNTNISHLFLF